MTLPAQWSDREWLAALGAGDDAAWTELRRRLLSGLRALLHRRPFAELDTGHLDAHAEDVVHEALLTIRAKLHTFKGESRFVTWAYRVAVNTLLSDLRRRRWQSRSATRLREAPAEWPVDGAALDPERVGAQRQLWTLLRALILDALTPHQRSILLAHAIEGQPLDLVAADHGISRDAVYKVLHDARRKLRAGLLAHGMTPRDVLEVFEPS